jgi:cytoskeletal protein CcmA (bactofilin family)
MTFPVSPANNDTATVNGITYVYSSATNSWARTTATSLTLAGNLIANKLFTTTGLFWSGNGFAVSTGGGGGGSAAGSQGSLQFNDGGSFNGSTIIYDSATGNVVITDTTDSVSTTTGAMVVKGGVGVAGNVVADKFYTTTGLYWAGNGTQLSTGGGLTYTSDTVPPGTPSIGDQWYNTSTDILYEYLEDGTSSYWVDIQSPSFNTALTANHAGNLNIVGNLTVTRAITATGNITTIANINSSRSANILGNLTVGGNVSFNRNVAITSNLTVSSNISSGNITTANISATGNITAIGTIAGTTISTANITVTSNITASNLTVTGTIIGNVSGTGDVTSSNVSTGNLTITGTIIGNVSTSGNVIATGDVISANVTTGNITITGNITGNVFTSGNITGANVTTTGNVTSANVVTGNITATNTITSANLVTGNITTTSNVTTANLTFTGTITGGQIAYMFEKANVIAAAPPANTDFNLLSTTIQYWTSNATTNITANIRGDATTPLSSLLAIGQSSTIAMMVPQATAYYVSGVKIDNTSITPIWQGSTALSSGNANSIDVYTFTIIRTGASTYKVFSSRTQYIHTG